MRFSLSPVFDFCRESSGLADLIFTSRSEPRVVHIVQAGDDDAAERMLGAARRGLLTSSSEEFAHEWRFPGERGLAVR